MDDNAKKIQKLQLDMLEETVRICDAFGIRYYLTEGSCLGAVRHGGFIPWDDDIDIAIYVSQHDEFVHAFQENASSRYAVIPAFSSGGRELCQILDTKIELSGGLLSKVRIRHPQLDVFLLHGLPSNGVLRMFHYARLQLLSKLSKAAKPHKILTRKRNMFARLGVLIAQTGFFEAVLDENSLHARLKKAMLKYDASESGYVSALTWYGNKEIMPLAVYGSGRKNPFERLQVNIPKYAEDYLERLYGDWRQLPPESERTGKHKLEIMEGD